jgi:hypothetical protein
MTIVRNDLLQTLRHVATNASDEVEIGCGPLFCDVAFELLHGSSMPSTHSSLEIVPQLFDCIEIRTPRRPVDEVDAMIVKPVLTRGGCMDSSIILLVPPVHFRPELVRRGDEIEAEDGLIAVSI